VKRLDLGRLPAGWGADLSGDFPLIYDARVSPRSERSGLALGTRSLGVFRNGKHLESGEVFINEAVVAFRTEAIDALKLCLVEQHQAALDEAGRLGLSRGDICVLGPGVDLRFEGDSGFKLQTTRYLANGKDFARFIAWLTKNGYTEV
jgi:hypothetical protein